MNEHEVNTYTQKINEQLTIAFTNWWNNLTKDEILDYLRNQPTVTADSLRSLMSETNTQLVFNACFDTNDNSASIDFNEE